MARWRRSARRASSVGAGPRTRFATSRRSRTPLSALRRGKSLRVTLAYANTGSQPGAGRAVVRLAKPVRGRGLLQRERPRPLGRIVARAKLPRLAERQVAFGRCVSASVRVRASPAWACHSAARRSSSRRSRSRPSKRRDPASGPPRGCCPLGCACPAAVLSGPVQFSASPLSMEAGWDFAVRNKGRGDEPGRSATLRIALRPPGGKVARLDHAADRDPQQRPARERRASRTRGASREVRGGRLRPAGARRATGRAATTVCAARGAAGGEAAAVSGALRGAATLPEQGATAQSGSALGLSSSVLVGLARLLVGQTLTMRSTGRGGWRVSRSRPGAAWAGHERPRAYLALEQLPADGLDREILVGGGRQGEVEPN